MTTPVPSPEPIIERYYALRKAEFGFLERFELRQPVDPREWNGFRLEVDLRSSAQAESDRLRLVFAGVRDLRIGELEGLLRYMIDIRSITAAQVEGRNYRLVEGEYDAFSFVCESFTEPSNRLRPAVDRGFTPSSTPRALCKGKICHHRRQGPCVRQQ